MVLRPWAVSHIVVSPCFSVGEKSEKQEDQKAKRSKKKQRKEKDQSIGIGYSPVTCTVLRIHA